MSSHVTVFEWPDSFNDGVPVERLNTVTNRLPPATRVIPSVENAAMRMTPSAGSSSGVVAARRRPESASARASVAVIAMIPSATAHRFLVLIMAPASKWWTVESGDCCGAN